MSIAQFTKELDLSDLNGQNCLIINGENAGDYSGYSVSSEGDVNGDGVGDLIIEAYDVGLYASKSYVTFECRFDCD